MFTIEEVKKQIKNVLLPQDLNINEFLIKMRPPTPTPRQIIEALAQLEEEKVIYFDGNKIKLK